MPAATPEIVAIVLASEVIADGSWRILVNCRSGRIDGRSISVDGLTLAVLAEDGAFAVVDGPVGARPGDMLRLRVQVPE